MKSTEKGKGKTISIRKKKDTNRAETGKGKAKENGSGMGKVARNKHTGNLHTYSEEKPLDEVKMIQGQSKQDQLINLLKQPDGSTIEDISKVTGWQHHSIRGVISGVLRKRLGLSVVSMKNEEHGRIYRIGA